MFKARIVPMNRSLKIMRDFETIKVTHYFRVFQKCFKEIEIQIKCTFKYPTVLLKHFKSNNSLLFNECFFCRHVLKFASTGFETFSQSGELI